MDIGADAFGSCLSLTTVGIPRSVAQIGIGAFLDKDDTGTYSLLPNLTIHGYYGSVAHTYARDNNIPFVDTTPTRTLSTPEDLTATNIVSGIRLNWKEVPKARYYLICYSFNGKYYQVAKTKSLTYTDEKVTNGARITYYVQALGYRMSSVNVLSSKPSTGVRIIRLTAPKLVVSSPQKRTVNLTWLRNAKASGYHIKMATNRSFTNARSIGASGGTRQFSGLVSGKVYYFIVRSYRDYGGKRYFSPWSNWTGVRVK